MIVCRVCRGTRKMNVLVLIGGRTGGASVSTMADCTACGATGVGGIEDWTPEQIAEAVRGTLKPKGDRPT